MYLELLRCAAIIRVESDRKAHVLMLLAISNRAIESTRRPIVKI